MHYKIPPPVTEAFEKSGNASLDKLDLTKNNRNHDGIM